MMPFDCVRDVKIWSSVMTFDRFKELHANHYLTIQKHGDTYYVDCMQVGCTNEPSIIKVDFPYPMCHRTIECVNKGSCPKEFACND